MNLVQLGAIQSLLVLHAQLLVVNWDHGVVVLAVDLVLLLSNTLALDLVLLDDLLWGLLQLVLQVLLSEQNLLSLRSTRSFVGLHLVLSLMPFFLVKEEERLRQVDILVDVDVLLAFLHGCGVVVGLLPVGLVLSVGQQLRTHVCSC